MEAAQKLEEKHRNQKKQAREEKWTIAIEQFKGVTEINCCKQCCYINSGIYVTSESNRRYTTTSPVQQAEEGEGTLIRDYQLRKRPKRFDWGNQGFF